MLRQQAGNFIEALGMARHQYDQRVRECSACQCLQQQHWPDGVHGELAGQRHRLHRQR